MGLALLVSTLLLVLRLPLNLDNQLTSGLQSATSVVASYLLDLMGIVHRLAGNVFFLKDGALFVEEACSGVQSIFTLLFCALMLVVWLRRSPALIPFYIVSAIVWALAMNIVRVTAIAVAQDWYGIDLAHGWKHEVLGYSCLVVAGLLLWSSDRFFLVAFFPVPRAEVRHAPANPIVNAWNQMFASIGGIASQESSELVDNDRVTTGNGWVHAAAMAMAAVLVLAVVPTNLIAHPPWGRSELEPIPNDGCLQKESSLRYRQISDIGPNAVREIGRVGTREVLYFVELHPWGYASSNRGKSVRRVSRSLSMLCRQWMAIA